MQVTMGSSRETLDEQFESVGDGLLLLLIGAVALPSGMLEYSAVAAVGAAFIGLNLTRAARGTRIPWFSTTLGAWGLIGGLAAMAGVRIDAFALLFPLLGIVTIGAAAFRSR